MKYTRRLLGKRGRTTIPYDFRKKLWLKYNDVLTFAMNESKNCVVITKEQICTDICKYVPNNSEISLDSFLSRMSKVEIIKTIAALSKALVGKEHTNETEDISD